jgi:hypothetical protein
MHGPRFASQKYLQVYAFSLFSWPLVYIRLYTLLGHDPTFETKRDDLVIPEIPDLPVALPGATSTFDLGADISLRKRYSNAHDLVPGLRLRLRPPVLLFNNELDRLKSFLQLLIVSISHTHQLIAIPCEELLCSTMARGQG